MTASDIVVRYRGLSILMHNEVGESLTYRYSRQARSRTYHRIEAGDHAIQVAVA